MATVVDTLITEYKLDSRGYKQGASDVVNATNSIAGSMGGLGSMGPLADMAKGGAMLGAAIVGVNTVLPALVGFIVGLAPALAAAASGLGAFSALLLGKPFLDAAAKMDSLKRSLVALTGSAENAAAVFANLKAVAALPGLGLPEAIQGFNQLFAAMLPATTAIAAMREFGNALSLVGKGRAELQLVVMALAQIASKGMSGITAIGEEINQQLAEQVPQIKKWMLNAFGSADTQEVVKKYGALTGVQFIQALIKEAEKEARATGGIQNAFENLGDTMLQAMATIGDAIASFLLPGLEKVASLVDYLTQSGALKGIAEAIGGALGGNGAGESMPRFVAMIIAVMENIPSIIDMIRDTFAAIMESGLQLFQHIATEISRFQNMIMDAIDKLWPFGDPMKYIREWQEVGKKFGWTSSAPDFNSLYEAGKKRGGDISDSILGRAAEILKGAEGWKPSVPGIPGELDQDRLGGSVSKHSSAMQETAQNTAEIVRIQKRQLQLQEGALGGGSVGRIGLAPREVLDIRRRSMPAMAPG